MNGIIGSLGRINDALEKLAKVSMVIIFFVILAIMMVNVILRYFFSSSISWTEEVGAMSMGWMVFLGGGIVARHSMHLSIDVLYERFGKRLQRYVSLMIGIVTIIVVSILIWLSIQVVQNLIDTNSVAVASGMPQYIYFLILPIGFVLTLLGTLEEVLKSFTNKDHRNLSDAEKEIKEAQEMMKKLEQEEKKEEF